jgi:uncharacterized membrane protein YphA (DoxX/SURF4 family)
MVSRVGAGAVDPAFTTLWRAFAHIRYVTEDGGTPVRAVEFALGVLSEPANALLFGGVAVLGTVGLLAYLWVRPTIPDVEVLRATLVDYRDLVPWMLRLAMGLPLVGAGFAGYYFTPVVPGSPRLLLIGLGFFLLFGLMTRLAAGIGLVAYLAGLATNPDMLLAMEYVPGLLAILIIGPGRPSADHMLGRILSTEGTLLGRLGPVSKPMGLAKAVFDPVTEYAATVARVGLGVTFVYLGLIEKLATPGRALLVVQKYDLTAIVPVDPGAWVLGAGLAEIALGVLLIGGLLTRAVAAAAFVVFTLTMFGLPDDPVLAHVTMFGLASAVFTLGSGPLALDRVLARAEEGGRAPDADRSTRADD